MSDIVLLVTEYEFMPNHTVSTSILRLECEAMATVIRITRSVLHVT
jgi:hypothetical protein